MTTKPQKIEGGKKKPLTEERLREIIREELLKIIVINPIVNVYPNSCGGGGGQTIQPPLNPIYPNPNLPRYT